MKIAVIGSGYVGLVAGTCFAETGNQVLCVDKDPAKIEDLKAGRIPIYEPGLEELVRRNVAEERLSFTTDTDAAVKASTVVFIAVGTPPGDDGSSDLSMVLAVARAIGKAMDGYKVIVDKSTVPVGTARKVAEAIRSQTSHPFDVVSNPEFLKEGAAIDDFMKPDRVVIGCDDPRVAEIMKELYSPFVRTGKPLLAMDVASAEMTKYAANAMLAARISFMNEMALLCEKVGADVDAVRRGIGTDSRIGPAFLFPGVGYGGSCFPKDVKALLKTSEENGLELHTVRAAEAANERQKTVLFSKLKAHFKGDLKGRTVGVWGLAFKPRTDDMREAPSIVLVEALLAAGAKVRAADPEAMKEARKIFGDRITYCAKPYDAVDGVDALVLVTEWNEFRHPDFDRMKGLMKSPVLFDGRNIWAGRRLAAQGWTYHGIGVRE
ncbi:MAG: UDP-glucose/GDP-mannose dehydrogenase family protein [Planctomycetaceae bacterium]|nr:UDP-glucose/GDP-mannose dehydrogenase family protein [Planctomycetaceae bacterium]